MANSLSDILTDGAIKNLRRTQQKSSEPPGFCYSKRMKKLLVFVIALIVMISPAHAQTQEEIIKEAKFWTLQIALMAMNVSEHSYGGHITLGEHTHSKKACENFVATLRNYDLYDRVFKDHETIKAELWERRVGVEPYEQVSIDEDHYKNGLHSWRFEVPMVLTFIQPNGFSTKANFIASVSVEQIPNNPHKKYEITSWHTKMDPQFGLKPSEYNERNYRPRKECGGVCGPKCQRDSYDDDD
jgi:hypothetical protein